MSSRVAAGAHPDHLFVPLLMVITVMAAIVTPTVAGVVTPTVADVVAVGGITGVGPVARAVITVTVAIMRATRNDYGNRK